MMGFADPVMHAISAGLVAGIDCITAVEKNTLPSLELPLCISGDVLEFGENGPRSTGSIRQVVRK